MGKTILGIAVIVCGLAAAAEAQYTWKPGFQWPGGMGTNDSVLTFAVFDDGGGPALYAAGSFTIADGVAGNHVAKWDGATWTTLGGGTNGRVYALAAFDDGAGPALYAGGDFTMAGSIATKAIAKWDGTSWAAVGGGMGVDFPFVGALSVFDDGSGPALFAGGYFRVAGGGPASNVAKWDGATWTPLSTGTDSSVLSLTIFDDGAGRALYAGGYFNQAGTATAHHIAKWDGVTWTSLSTGTNGFGGVLALAVFDDGTGPALYAGGGFAMAGDASANNVAKWNGMTWSALGDGIGGDSHSRVSSLAIFDEGTGPVLYCGGVFTLAGGNPMINIAKWDGARWAPLAGGVNGDGVATMTAFSDSSGPALYVGGYFTMAGGVISNNVAKWAAQ